MPLEPEATSTHAALARNRSDLDKLIFAATAPHSEVSSAVIDTTARKYIGTIENDNNPCRTEYAEAKLPPSHQTPSTSSMPNVPGRRITSSSILGQNLKPRIIDIRRNSSETSPFALESSPETSPYWSADVEMMDGVLTSIPEEESEAPLSKTEDASIESASTRDYGSISSVDLASRPPNSLTTSLVQDLKRAAHSRDISAVFQDHPEQDFFPAAQGANSTNADRYCNAAEPIANSTTLPHVGAHDLVTMPVLVPTSTLTRAVSPTALLLMIDSGRVPGELSKGDSSRIQYLATGFQCARSYRDADQLRRLISLPSCLDGRTTGYFSNYDRTRVWRAQLRDAMSWCINVLAEDGFWRMLLSVTPSLWSSTPSEEHVRNAECALLSVYLWTQQPTKLMRQNPISDSVMSQSESVHDFAHALGWPVVDVVSMLAIRLTTPNVFNRSREQATLSRRALMSAQAAYDSCTGDLGEAFSFMATSKDSRPTDEYATLVYTVVREHVEKNVHLELEVSTLHDPRLQHRSSQASMAPSFSPTMLSTPRSSWSGYRSFKSAAWRSSKLMTDTNNRDNDAGSFFSSRRFSRAGSIRSAFTLQSSTNSDRDILMEDDDAA
jgi:hypothetical protein